MTSFSRLLLAAFALLALGAGLLLVLLPAGYKAAQAGQAAAPIDLEGGAERSPLVSSLESIRADGRVRAEDQRQAVLTVGHMSIGDRLDSALTQLEVEHRLSVQGRIVDEFGFPREEITLLAGTPLGVLNHVATTSSDGSFSFILASSRESADLLIAAADGATWSGLIRIHVSARSPFEMDLELPDGSGASDPDLDSLEALVLDDGALVLTASAQTPACERPSDMPEWQRLLVQLRTTERGGIAHFPSQRVMQSQHLVLTLATRQLFDGQFEQIVIDRTQLRALSRQRLISIQQSVRSKRLKGGSLVHYRESRPVFQAEVEVRDSINAPVPFAKIALLGDDGQVQNNYEADELGRLTIELGAGKRRLLAGVMKGPHDDALLEGAAGDNLVWKARLDPGRSVRLQLESTRGNQQAAHRFELEVRSRNHLWARQAERDQDDGIAFHHVPPGSARLLVYSEENEDVLPDLVIPVAAAFLTNEPQALLLDIPAASALTIWDNPAHERLGDPVWGRLFDEQAQRGTILEDGSTERAFLDAPTQDSTSAYAPYLPGRTLRLVAGDHVTGLHDRAWVNAAPLPDGSSAPEVVRTLAHRAPALVAIGENAKPLLLKLEDALPILYRAAEGNAAPALQLPPGEWWFHPQHEDHGFHFELAPTSVLDLAPPAPTASVDAESDIPKSQACLPCHAS